MNPPTGADALLGLLRFGEMSAAAAFARMLRGRSSATTGFVASALAPVAADELKHERWLVDFCERRGIAALAPARPVRHFFASLASADLEVHLARIAALDGCVCQTLSQVLRTKLAQDADLAALLRAIRHDEAHHVAIARNLARHWGVREERLNELNDETRHSFARVLDHYRQSFDALAVDSDSLTTRIRRHVSG
jgi:hypothetical protein